MNLVVNGDPRELDGEPTVADLLRHLELESQRVAVLVNGDIVRRAEHGARRLAERDAVDIVHMVGGG